MSDPLLLTKLTVPPYRPGLIPRTRLIEALKASFDLGTRLIMISAPAGSGKSMLVSEWAAGSRAIPVVQPGRPAIRFAWLSLDPADNQPNRFWFHLISVLQTAFPDAGQAELRLLSFPEPPPIKSILTNLLNQIEAQPERMVLVLDDYHCIVEPSIHEGITFILEYMPANVQLCIATRADPPLPLSRLRVRQQLLEIRSADLFFTLLESGTLINDVMGLGLSTDDLVRLEERTEGWAAGVQLAAILLMDERRKAGEQQAGERLSALVGRLSGRQHLIADYLMDEVFDRQPEEVQEFLLSSSVLDEFCASLCDALIGYGNREPNSRLILETLDRLNLFLIPLDEEHTWFRYHHLFADALRIRLEQTRPGSASGLHRSASQWYERNGQPEKAIEHALAAEDHDRAASLIEANVIAFTRQGRYTALLNWLENIPVQVVLAHPHIGVYKSQALALSGKLSAAEQQLRAIEASVEEAVGPGIAPLSPELRGKIAAVRATAAILKGDAGLAIEQSERAIELLPPDDPSLAGVLLVLGNAVQKIGDVSRSIQLLREAVAQSRRTDDLSTLLTSCVYLAAGLSLQGKLHQVEAVLLEALEEVNHQLGASDWPLPMLAMIYQRLGLVKKEWDDLAGAEQVMTRALRIAENSSYLSAVANAYGGLASLRRSQGRFDQAIELVEKALQMIPRRESSLYIDLLQALRAEYWIYSGNLPAARRWAKERGLSAERAIDYVGANELYLLVRLWIAEDRADEADALATRVVASGEVRGQAGLTITFLVLQALARRGAGRLDLAVQSLERALILGEPEGYLRVFLDEGDQLVDLLQRLARQKSKVSAFARLLLSKLVPGTSLEQPPASSRPSQTRLVEPLTDREMAVLRQMAAGSSNLEISERMVISVGTVKAHIYHITAKLGARSRTEAVARAREAGLLP
jgi:LuxR family maltose regulon positive regulatory protein